MFNTPILLLVFNRPEETKTVLNQISAIKPRQLFVAADAPRLGNEKDEMLCTQTRQLFDRIDWDCEIKTLFRTQNLGCGKAVSQAITWFFENVEEGIILEDDCLPDISFFRFCAELLAKYRTDNEVMSISGSNLLGRSWKENLHSYLLKKFTHFSF